MFRGCSTGPRQGQRLEFKRVRQTGNRAGGTSASKAGAHRPLLCAGSGAAVAARRYWRLWWTASASPGPAIGSPPGCWRSKRKCGAGWTAITKRMAPLASCCSFIRSAVTSSSGSARPSRRASLKPRPTTPIGLDKAPGGGRQLQVEYGHGAVGFGTRAKECRPSAAEVAGNRTEAPPPPPSPSENNARLPVEIVDRRAERVNNPAAVAGRPTPSLAPHSRDRSRSR